MYLNPDVVGQSSQMKNGSWIARIGMAQLWFLPTMQRNNWRRKKIFRDCINIPIGYLFVGHWTVPEHLSHTKVKVWPANWDCRVCISLLTGIGLKRGLWWRQGLSRNVRLMRFVPGSMTWTIKWWWWLRPVIPLGLLHGFVPKIIFLCYYVFRRIVSMPCGRLNRWILVWNWSLPKEEAIISMLFTCRILFVN